MRAATLTAWPLPEPTHARSIAAKGSSGLTQTANSRAATYTPRPIALHLHSGPG